MTALSSVGLSRRYLSVFVSAALAALSVAMVSLGATAAPAPPLLLTPPANTAVPAPGADVPPPPDPHAVAVDTLEAPHPDSMGLVDATGGGFSDALWHGTPAETAQALVAGLPHRYAALAARALARRFLLSAASAPGSGRAGAMLEARIFALAAMADWDDALALIDLVPMETRSPILVQTRINGLLAKDRVEAACGEGSQTLAQSTDVYWQKLQVLCQFAVGQNSAAAVSLGLLREQGADDKVFFWAVDTVQGNVSPPPSDLMQAGGTVDPLVLALLRRSGTLLPDAVVRAGDPNVLTYAAQIALAPPPKPAATDDSPPKTAKGKAAAKKAAAEKAASPDAADELRLVTIERAVAAGVADPDSLRGAYAALDLHDAPTVPADSIAIDTAHQRAATYQLALAQSAPASRAEVIARVIDLARTNPGRGPDVLTTALIYAPMVAALTPSADLVWFAGSAVRILMAADSVAASPNAANTARPWIDMLNGMAASSNDAVTTILGLWPYTRLSHTDSTAAASSDFAAWQVTLPTDMRGAALRNVVFDLLPAVGESLPTPDLQAAIAATGNGDIAGPGVMPPSILWTAAALATKDGRVGEAVALALRFLGADNGPPASIAVTQALQTLTAVGRAADARALAIELALERGL